MFKKIISTICFIFSVFIGCQINVGNIAYAQDVWAYNDGYNDHYLVAPVEHVERDNGFTCTVKIVHNGNFVNLYHVRYAYGKGLVMNYYLMDRQRATWKFMGNINNDPCIAAIYATGNKY